MIEHLIWVTMVTRQLGDNGNRSTNRKSHKELERKKKKKEGILELEEATHLDGAAEGDLAITLREVHVAHTEISSFNEHREVHLASPAQVLDVAIAAVLSPGNGSACFRCDSLPILRPLVHLRITMSSISAVT